MASGKKKKGGWRRQSTRGRISVNRIPVHEIPASYLREIAKIKGSTNDTATLSILNKETAVAAATTEDNTDGQQQAPDNL